MKILNARPWEGWEKQVLIEAEPDAVFLEPGDGPSVEELLNQADVLYGFPPVPMDVITDSKSLRLMHVPSTGVDKFITPGLRSSRLVLTNSRGVQAKPVAEHAVALMFALAYGFRELDRKQKQAVWENLQIPRLEGQTVCLLGLGTIGHETAKRCKALEMKVIGVRRAAGPDVPGVDQVYLAADTGRAVAGSDYVLSSLPLTEQTYHSIDYSSFCAMKPSACFINVGRGPVVDEAGLIRALEEGKIRGAGLDVFETEPLPKESPLWKMDSVVITPHLSGHSPNNDRKSLAILAENLRRMRAGQPLVNVVDKTLGY